MPINPSEDVAAFLATAGFGLVQGSNLFVGTPKAPNALIPRSAVFVLGTGGPKPEPYIGQVKDFIRSRVQVTIRSNSDAEGDGEALARNIAAVLHRANLGPGYVSCVCMDAEPIALGRSETGLYSWTVNTEVWWVREGLAAPPGVAGGGAYTLPAAQVSVAAITGLAAADAQAAFAEHQADVDAITAQLVPATTTVQGFVSTLAQNFAGLKTFVAGLALQAALKITNVASGANAIEIPSGARIVGGVGAAYVALRQGVLLDDTQPVFEINQGNQTNVPGFSLTNCGPGGTGFNILHAGGGKLSLGPVSASHNWVYSENRSIIIRSGNNAYDPAATAGVFLQSTGKPTIVAVKIEGSLDQTANLLELNVTGGAAKASINKDGGFSGQAFVASVSLTAPSVYADNFFARTGGASARLTGLMTDAVNAVSVVVDTNGAFATAGAKIASLRNSGTEKASIDKDGQYENASAGFGIILKSPNGTRYKVTVSDAGALVVAAA